MARCLRIKQWEMYTPDSCRDSVSKAGIVWRAFPSGLRPRIPRVKPRAIAWPRPRRKTPVEPKPQWTDQHNRHDDTRGHQSLIADQLTGFVFQAEDGIRDDLVTGVQTCALPI